MSLDFSAAWNTGARIINEAISLIPNAILALVIFAFFLITASLSGSLVRRLAVERRKHQGIALLLGRLVYTTIIVLGFLVGLSVIAPSFHASDLIKVLGIGSVAVGFAFQNILQNFLTGIEGTVKDIQSRATVIATKEGRQVLIPNAIIFTNPVAVERPAEQRVGDASGATAFSGWHQRLAETFGRPSSRGTK